MSTDHAAAAIYRGIWRHLGAWLKVPAEPPALPSDDAEPLRKIHPAPGFLRYLKLKFWVGLTALDGALLLVWLALSAANPRAAAILLVPALLIAIVPDIVVYIALQLRYDSTWYVMSSRSLRIRRGIWVLREMTITFENVQNIKVTQGPLMRLYGIKNLVVETAGAAVQTEGGPSPENQAVLEGLDDADAIRDSILARVRASRSAGLGDEARAEVVATMADERHAPPGWTPAQVQVLREIRDEAALLAR